MSREVAFAKLLPHAGFRCKLCEGSGHWELDAKVTCDWCGGTGYTGTPGDTSMAAEAKALQYGPDCHSMYQAALALSEARKCLTMANYHGAEDVAPMIGQINAAVLRLNKTRYRTQKNRRDFLARANRPEPTDG